MVGGGLGKSAPNGLEQGVLIVGRAPSGLEQGVLMVKFSVE